MHTESFIEKLFIKGPSCLHMYIIVDFLKMKGPLVFSYIGLTCEHGTRV